MAMKRKTKTTKKESSRKKSVSPKPRRISKEEQTLLQFLMSPKGITKLGTIHWVVEKAFKKFGYEWGTIRRGDSELGFWKIRFSKTKKSQPRRLVIIPGFGDSSASWHPFVALTKPALQKKYDEVILVDFPGWNGFLAECPCFDSLDQLFATTGDLLDQFKPKALMGHSLGGWISANYAVECGTGVRPKIGSRNYSGPEDLILISPSGVFGAEEEAEKFKNRFFSAMDEGFGALRKHVFAKEPIWFKLFMSEFAAFLEKPEVVKLMRSVDETHRLEERVHQIKSRVWLVWGDSDTLTFSSWMNDWLRLLPKEKTKGVWFLNAGHSPHIEKPAAFALLLIQILQGKEPHSLGKWWWKPAVSIAPDEKLSPEEFQKISTPA